MSISVDQFNYANGTFTASGTLPAGGQITVTAPNGNTRPGQVNGTSWTVSCNFNLASGTQTITISLNGSGRAVQVSVAVPNQGGDHPSGA